MNHLLYLKNAKDEYLSDIKEDDSPLVSLIRLCDENELLKLAYKRAKIIVEDFDNLVKNS